MHPMKLLAPAENHVLQVTTNRNRQQELITIVKVLLLIESHAQEGLLLLMIATYILFSSNVLIEK